MKAMTALACLTAALLTGTAWPQSPAPGIADKEIAELIRKLASNNFKVREEAQRLLLQREDAPPALRRALLSKDKELVRRASELLDEFQRREILRALEKVRTLGKQGYVDQVVERLVCREDWGGHEDAAFQVLSDITGKLFDLQKKQGGLLNFDRPRQPGDPGPSHFDPLAMLPFRDFLRYKNYVKPTYIFLRPQKVEPFAAYVFRGEDVSMQKVMPSSVTFLI